MMLLGLVWVFTAPLSLLLAGAALFYILGFSGLSRTIRIAFAAVITVVPVASVWWLDYREFVRTCEQTGKPRIFQRATADGIYLDSQTANSFGMNYLHQQGFSWMEMRSIYDRTKFERVTRDANGQIRTAPIDTITARYEVRETFEQPHPHTGLSMKYVYDRQTGVLMAQAGSAHFSGGRMKWVLGMYGSRSYPSAMTNGDDFKGFYYLAQYTLRPQANQ